MNDLGRMESNWINSSLLVHSPLFPEYTTVVDNLQGVPVIFSPDETKKAFELPESIYRV